MKLCSRCGESKPHAEFHKRKRSKDGLAGWCKGCTREYSRAWYERNGEKCKETFRAYHAANKEAVNQKRRERWANDDEFRAERQAAWRERYSANIEAERAKRRAWKERNPERYLESVKAWQQANPEKVREAWRKYAREHPERTSIRRALLAQVAVGNVDLDALWTGNCGICGGEMDRDLPHPDPNSKSIDHIVPLACGGTHEQANLQWAHLRCNQRKGARTLVNTEEW